jgi:hypothetical protein
MDFEPWQTSAISAIVRSLPNVPAGLVVRRARLVEGIRGNTLLRSDGYTVLLDVDGLSIGAFMYLAAHEILGHVAQGHPRLLRDAGRLLVKGLLTADELEAIEHAFELAADLAVERSGYSRYIESWLKQYPDDRLKDRSWEPAVRSGFNAALEAAGERLEQRKQAKAAGAS